MNEARFRAALRAYPWWDLCNIEQPARQRRTALFAECTGLLPISNRLTDEYENRVREKVMTDHRSVWISGSGTLFMLNELYSPTHGGDLCDEEFISISVPVDLSPYCGGYSAKVGVKPRSLSYLICEAKHREELQIICAKLVFVALSAPPWNYAEGDEA